MSQRATWARYLAAIALLGVGLDHLEQFSVDHYSAVPTIGTLFALNFASAALIAGGLLAPVGRLPGRAGRIALPVLAFSGIGVAVGSLAGLLLSESIGLFGFMESGYRGAIVLSIGLELAAAGLLSAALAAAWPARARPRRSHVPPAAPDVRPPSSRWMLPLDGIEPVPDLGVVDDDERRIDDLLDHLRALVLERGLLETKHADELELRANQREIRRTRERLARALAARQSHSPPPAA